MSTITKEQMLKFAAAWQAVLLLATWYLNEFGIDTLNRLLFGIALLVVFIITFLRKDNTEKVVTAIGTIDRFLKSNVESQKAKEISDGRSGLDQLIDAFVRVKELNLLDDDVSTAEDEPEKPKEFEFDG